MPSPSLPGIIISKIVYHLAGLRSDQRGTVAIMMGVLLPVIVGGLGLGFELSNWYMRTRSMQNAADAAAIAAATNASSNYDVEAKAVAAQFGYVNGSNNVTVTPSNAATCPSVPNINPPCYSVTITSLVPLYLSQVVGYTGDTTLNGSQEKTLSSEAIAYQTIIKQPICLLALDKTGQALTTDGSPNANFTGCTVMSNSSAKCNGSNLLAFMGIAAGTNTGCGNIQYSDMPTLSDPYAGYASNIPTNLPTTCNNSYSQESKHGNTWSGGTTWSGSYTLTGTASVAGNTLICGDLRLTGNTTINAPDGAVLYIENGLLDLQGYTLSTASGSAVTIVFTGTGGNGDTYNHYPTDNSGGSSGVLDIQAPTDGPFPGMAIYQDPSLTKNLGLTYSGNSPTWDISGGVYLPNADVTISGAVNKSANGANCFVLVSNDVTINGSGSIYQQSPDGSGCKTAGLTMPTEDVPGRGQLVY